MRHLPFIYLFALLCVPFYIGPELATNVQLNLERVTLALLAAGVLIGVFGPVIRPALRFLWQNSPVFLLCFAGFFLWRITASILSPYAVSKYLVINELISNAFVFLLFFQLYFRRGAVQTVLRVLALSVLWMALVVAVEVATGTNPFTPLAPASAGQAILDANIERAGLLRAKGAFEHPLTLGQYVIFLLPVILFMDRTLISRRRALTLGALLFAFGVATGSRATLVIMSVEVLLYLLFWGLRIGKEGRQVNLGGMLWVFVPVVAVLVASFAEQITGNSLFSSYTRVAQIVNGLIAVGDAPWVGFGQGEEFCSFESGMRPTW